MTGAFSRKLRQVAGDPVLRRWLWARALGRTPAPPAFTPHVPPYAEAERQACLNRAAPDVAEAAAPSRPGPDPLTLPLAGHDLTVDPDRPEAPFALTFADTEVLLALHRFAWLPVLGPGAPADWVDCLWAAWCARFLAATDGWPWHPYTATERALNRLDWLRAQGRTPDARDRAALAAHVSPIAERLEYFGEHHTSNHLYNTGRGLFRLGLALDDGAAADLGAAILANEADRVRLPSGVLREGSSHYHLLFTRWALDAWLAARRHGHALEPRLRDDAASAVAAAKTLMPKGRLALIGDVSPDCPPDHVTPIVTGDAGGWMAWLDGEDRTRVRDLVGGVRPAADDVLASDGWAILSGGPWTGVIHAAPEGFSHMPGHGHQDCAAPVLWFDGEPVAVDPGRGRYGADADARRHVGAALHGGLSVDGADPFPENRPYYAPAFRRAVAGPPPVWRRLEDGWTVSHDGFARLGRAGTHQRSIRVDGRTVLIADSLGGSATDAHVVRRLVTPAMVEAAGDGGADLVGPVARIRLSVDPGTRVEVDTVEGFAEYGRSHPLRRLTMSVRTALPWKGAMHLEPV